MFAPRFSANLVEYSCDFVNSERDAYRRLLGAAMRGPHPMPQVEAVSTLRRVPNTQTYQTARTDPPVFPWVCSASGFRQSRL